MKSNDIPSGGNAPARIGPLQRLRQWFDFPPSQRGPNSLWYLEHRNLLEDYALEHWKSELGPVHGPEHWRRVESFGSYMWDPKKTDIDVIVAFAYLHDVEREDNLDDLGHGPRAAELVDSLRDGLLSYMSNRQIRLLKKACRLHSCVDRTDNATVNTCFDADRLDLPRCGTAVDPGRLATHYGRMICLTQWYRKMWSDTMSEPVLQEREDTSM